jgi:hypothetical protein
MSFEREVASPLASESGLGAIRDLEHEFGRAFAQAELYGARLDDRLRHVIYRVVDDSKASGKSADDIVAMIRDLARRGGFARPDAVAPVSSFPADRLLTKAITACIERYHEAEEPAAAAGGPHGIAFNPEDLAVIASGGDTRGALSARIHAALSHENESAFTSAVALYIRSAIARGLDVDQALAGVNRIFDAIDGPRRAPGDEVSRAGQLVIRGLVQALYDRPASPHEGVAAGDHPTVRTSYLKPADRPITQAH